MTLSGASGSLRRSALFMQFPDAVKACLQPWPPSPAVAPRIPPARRSGDA
jgi:hypothetical protein